MDNIIIGKTDSTRATITNIHLLLYLHYMFNIGGNTMCLVLWKEKATTPMNIQHCGFGIGSLIIPQIVQPFLAPDKQAISLNNNLTEPLLSPTVQTLLQGSRIAVPYTIVTIALVLVAIVWLALILKGPPPDFPCWIPQGRLSEMMSPGSCAKGFYCYSTQLLTLLFLFYIFCGPAPRIYFEFLFSFTTEGALQMSRSDAILLQTIYWLCYTVGRGGLGALTAIIPVQAFLFTICLLMTIFIIVIAFFTSQSLVIMWTFNCLFGFVCGLPFPNAIAWANQYLDINSMATMVLMVGNSAGILIFQSISGKVYDMYSPDAVKFLPAIASIGMIFIFIIMQSIAYFHRKDFKHALNDKRTFQESLTFSVSV